MFYGLAQQWRNASSTDPATLLAIYVAPKNATVDDLMKPI
jgi:hypothetical protein